MVLFEHERLRVGQKLDSGEFTEETFLKIAKWRQRTGHVGLEVGYDSIKATQWVGVIQAGKTTIEILPKADVDRYAETDRNTLVDEWRFVLLEMLGSLKGFDLHNTSRAQVHLQSHTILDLFFCAFVEETEALMREGLVKTYRHVAKNRTAWRGRLLVGENLRRNLVHREKIFTEAIEFDVHNSWNRILVAGLQVVTNRAENALLGAKARGLLIPFQDWNVGAVGKDDFDRLRYDRRTERYRDAMELAKMILLRQNPDLCAGSEDVFALLFDMSKLWEAWVAEQIRKSIHGTGWHLKTQSVATFWMGGESELVAAPKKVRPDLVLVPPGNGQKLPKRLGLPELSELTVLDTKWKAKASWIPDDADLKQMFVYNHLWGANDAWLLYPKLRGADLPASTGFGHFLAPGIESDKKPSSRCAVAFLDLPKKRRKGPAELDGPT